MPAIQRHPIAIALIVIALLLLIGSTVAIVPETKQGVVVRFGDPKAIINRYRANETFGKTGAGVILRWPFIDQIVWIDKRVLSVEMERQQVLSTDQLRLQVDAFARYRIVDPLRMYIAAGSEERVSDALRPILGSALRNELGKRPFAALLSPERGQVMQNIEAGLDRVARQYGAEIVDVRIKRADLPDGTPLESAFTRMRTAREQEALTIRAQGAKQAQIIRAEADANAARIYSDSFGKDPQFYDFYRAMQSYRFTFAPDKQGQTNMILSRDNEFLRQFQGR
ncbi:membrane protease subunit HflC [Sphingobium wenxiniae]|uniref:Protein HflC n=2 Tax=Sphingobium TaxID=165695 RepID=T0GAH7_9SPHN|nr:MULTISPECIES: SPFH domain-containing protein [Sphingobium]EQA97027.1 membrane protease subunit HflC [Sphingobium baderi LL03]KMS64185.1 membrane protease subunit HflC [Sphingobium baderi LL03]MBB6192877.1 membrane protease subunit HflC [Sphingobium wenxiniae]TWH95314.1 membrane protease subunit HflC [Sphingobium wenxiniae]WRD78052.1 protease modulator HflC [Sphingobium baderi]